MRYLTSAGQGGVDVVQVEIESRCMLRRVRWELARVVDRYLDTYLSPWSQTPERWGARVTEDCLSARMMVMRARIQDVELVPDRARVTSLQFNKRLFQQTLRAYQKGARKQRFPSCQRCIPTVTNTR